MTTSRSEEPRIRVTRTLVYEGPETWVRQTLARSFIGSIPFEVVGGTIVETTRFEESVAVLPEEKA